MQLPEELLNRLCEDPGFDKAAFIAAHDQDRIHSIRLNPFKQTELDFSTDAVVPWCEHGLYLFSRPSFTHDPLFHAGCYYVQEAGSMFLEQIIRNHIDLSRPLKVLDLCAAPGGKSTHLNSLITTDSLLVSNEVIKSRAEVLAENLGRWGTANTVVTSVDPARLAACGARFDLIVTDAPCSGSGLFRKQPEALLEWSPEAVHSCSLRQRRILADIMPALMPGGLLIYSTCSYSPEENEDIVAWMEKELELESVPLTVDPASGIVNTGAGLRFYPHLVKTEGFFCSVLRKKESESGENYRQKKPAKNKSESTAELSAMIADGQGEFHKINNSFHYMTAAASEFFRAFEKDLFFRKAGVRMGEFKGKDFIPDQQLAWSTELSPQFRRAELDKENALKFLKKEAFQVQAQGGGFSLMTYKGFGLGWAKVLQNRVNNYYPNELRILR